MIKVQMLTEKQTKVLENAIAKQQQAVSDTGDKWGEYGKKLDKAGAWTNRIGMRIGWLAYRMVSIGRIIVRFFMQIVRTFVNVYKKIFQLTKQIVTSMAEWQKGIGTVATAMGYLYATNLGTTESLASLDMIMGRLITIGPQFQGLWAGIQSAILGVFSIVAEGMLPTLTELTNALLEVVNVKEFQDWLLEISTAFYDQVFPALTALIDWIKMAPPEIIGLADAFGELASVLLTELLPTVIAMAPEIVGPILEALQQLVAMAPALLAELPELIESFFNAFVQGVPLLINLIKSFSWFANILASVLGLLGPFAPLLMVIGTAMYFLSPLLMTIGTLTALAG